jgi:hypothetical protein
MIHITEQVITMTVKSAKEIMSNIILNNMDQRDDATFSLKLIGRGDAEFIAPFPHNLDSVQPIYIGENEAGKD